MNICMVVATHKEYEMPIEPSYLPLQVGATGKEDFGYARDDTGENISEKNPCYCELTGLYWAWKNPELCHPESFDGPADAVGLVHYRRHFTQVPRRERKKNALIYSVLTKEQAEEILNRADVIVPKERNYIIETLYSHYAHSHDGRHLDLAKEIIAARCPEYLPAVETVYARTWGYMFNMLITRRETLDAYCSWLFPLLGELEERLAAEPGTGDLSAFDQRLYGRVSEILFNVWLKKQQESGLVAEAVPWMSIEPVNWLKKGSAFLAAKFLGKKYGGSF